MDSLLASYRRHSVVTHPGLWSGLLDGLPSDPASLIEVVAGLIIHHATDKDLLAAVDVASRRGEVDIRFVSAMLARIAAMNDGPLTEARPPEARLLATCRDTAVMLCALFRQAGVPARVRYGFTPFLYEPSQLLHDHAVVEYWDGGAWRLADSRLSRGFVEHHGIRHVPAVDVPRHLVRTGGQAWRRVRRGEEQAKLYAGLRRSNDFGLWTVRNLFVYDLASLAGIEPLMWDAWGVMLLGAAGAAPFVPAQLEFLDEMAELDPLVPSECAALVRRFREAQGLYPDDEIVSFSPVNGQHRVSLAAHRGALEWSV